jgi:hypothetical protein
MRIQWLGKTRAHIEGIGYVAPGGEVDVLESVGVDLCSGGEFKEVQRPKSKDQNQKTLKLTASGRQKVRRGLTEADAMMEKHTAAAEAARQEEV